MSLELLVTMLLALLCLCFIILLLLNAWGSLDEGMGVDDECVLLTSFFLCLRGHLLPLAHLPDSIYSGQSNKCCFLH